MVMKIIKKNELTVLVIAFMLVTAGYLDYIGKINNTEEASTEIVDNNTDEVAKTDGLETEELGKTGDATLVNGEAVTEEQTTQVAVTTDENKTNNDKKDTTNSSQDSYFVTSKLERANMYSQTIANYQKVLDSQNVSEEQRAITTQEITKVTQTQNAIMICENLLLAKGFDKSIIFVNDKSISVIIGKESLSQEEIAQIQNIIARELNAEVNDIHISTK